MNLLKYAVHEKGVAIGAHGVRSGKDYVTNISYACSVQAGDHTSVAFIPLDHGNSELRAIMYDSTIYCFFNAFKLEDVEILQFYEAVTGWRLNKEEWYREKGLRILQLQRAMLLLGGPDVQWKPKIDDDNPPRFWESLPSGPYRGKTLNRKTFEEDRFEYYRLVGWGKTGVPKPETLRKLGLQDVEAKLREAGLIK